jgi:hypothetical protein
MNDEQADGIIEDGKDEEFLVDSQRGFTMQHSHLHRRLESAIWVSIMPC